MFQRAVSNDANKQTSDFFASLVKIQLMTKIRTQTLLLF